MGDIIVFELDYVQGESMPVEKDAKIFEAGDYPDKGISVTEEDLDVIVRNFRETPIKVEHTDTPLDPLGVVKRVWRIGKELFARLAFPSDIAKFLDRRGVKKLSVGLLKDPLRLAEVSLVLNPRIRGAAMFGTQCEEEDFLLRACPSIEGKPDFGHGRRVGVGEVQEKTDREEVRAALEEITVSGGNKDREIAELKFALKSRDVEAKLAHLKRSGKLVPASEPFARAILMNADQLVTFSGGELSVAELFLQFLEAHPKVIEFSEVAPGVNSEQSAVSPEYEELLSKLGVTREKLDKYNV